MSYKADLKNISVELIDRNPENPRIFFRQEEMEQLSGSEQSRQRSEISETLFRSEW